MILIVWTNKPHLREFRVAAVCRCHPDSQRRRAQRGEHISEFKISIEQIHSCNWKPGGNGLIPPKFPGGLELQPDTHGDVAWAGHSARRPAECRGGNIALNIPEIRPVEG